MAYLKEYDVVQVNIGGEICAVLMANETAIECVVGPAAKGPAPISVNIPPLGLADCNETVFRDFAVTSVTPKNGSLAGSDSGIDLSARHGTCCILADLQAHYLNE